jgi:hypothetical protein
MTSRCLGAHAASDTLWRAIALARFSHLATIFALLPVPKPPFESLVRNFIEATRATALNEPRAPEIPTVTIADYIFQYEVFVDGKIAESWAGRLDFCVMPGENAVARVVFPLTEECTRLVRGGEENEEYGYPDTWFAATKIRIIVMEGLR